MVWLQILLKMENKIDKAVDISLRAASKNIQLLKKNKKEEKNKN